MDFKSEIHKLVARICSYFEDNRLSAPGLVRTTKLVYLMECDYYAWERERLADLDWILWHYGPWSKSLDTILKIDIGVAPEKELEGKRLIPVNWTMPEFDKPNLKLKGVAKEGMVSRVLDRFATMPYNKLLDYVYFETAPMKSAVKGKLLDFTEISKPQRFVDPARLLPPKVFHNIKAKFEKLEPSSELEDREGLGDADLWELFEAMDQDGLLVLPQGEVIINDEVRSQLKANSGD